MLKSSLNFFYVFVYGTLKHGEPNHHLITNTENGLAKFIGVGKTTTKYPLIIATKYNIPFLLKKANSGNQIFGEVYQVDKKMLSKLDELEEHPDFYTRLEEKISMLESSGQPQNCESIKNLETNGTEIEAWVYFLPKFRESLLELPMYSCYSNNGQHGLKYKERYERFPINEYNYHNDVLC